MANKIITVQGKEITVLSQNEGDLICLTDIAQNFEVGVAAIESWMRNRNTVEFLGTWESLYNPHFNSVGFDGIKAQVGLNTFKLSVKKWMDQTNSIGMTAKEWKLTNPEAKGNLRDHASAEQLLVLVNLQSLNAKLLEWDSPKDQRLEILNKTAREQMEILVSTKAFQEIKKLTGEPKNALPKGKKI